MQVPPNPSTAVHFAPRNWPHHHFHDGHEQQYIVHLARDTFLVNRYCVAALTWVVYDLILCSGKEVALVWNRWHLQKGRHSRRLYVIVRYLSVLGLALFLAVNTSTDLTLDFCNAWYYILVIITTAITLLPDVMILIRINAVYAWNITTLIFTASLFFIQLLSSLAIGFLTISTAQISLSPPSIPGCSIGNSSLQPTITLAAWIPSILVQFAYLILTLNTLRSGMHDLDLHGRPIRENLAQMRELMPTMVVFIRHGVIYFSIAIATKIANAIVVITKTGPLQVIGILWMMAIYPILVCRIYLGMVEYIHGGRSSLAHFHHRNNSGNARFSSSSGLEPSVRVAERDLGQITFAAPEAASTLLDIMHEEF